MSTPIGMKSAACGTGTPIDEFGATPWTQDEINRASRAIISALAGTTMVTFDGSTASASNGHPIAAGSIYVLDDAALIQALNIHNSNAVTITLLM